MELVVKRGEIVVELSKGWLTARAAEIKTRILDTTIYLQVADDGTAGTLFLKEGKIEFPDYEMAIEGKNRAFHLQAGAGPVETTLTDAQIEQYRGRIKHGTRSVWGDKAFYERPLFWGGVGAALAAGVIVLVLGGFGTGRQDRCRGRSRTTSRFWMSAGLLRRCFERPGPQPQRRRRVSARTSSWQFRRSD
jgi:hypothetical protein